MHQPKNLMYRFFGRLIEIFFWVEGLLRILIIIHIFINLRENMVYDARVNYFYINI